MKKWSLILLTFILTGSQAWAGFNPSKILRSAAGQFPQTVTQKAVDDAATAAEKAKAQVNLTSSPLAVKQATIEAIDKASSTAAKAVEQKNESQKDLQDFAIAVIGLAATNFFTLWGLFSGRKKRKLEEEKLTLEIAKLKSEIKK